MAVSSNPNNEKTVYKALRDAGLNSAAACGILANIYNEISTFESGILEYEAQKSSALGMSSEEYTSYVDTKGDWPEKGKSGYMYKDDYGNPIYYADLWGRVGYGLVGWTDPSLKTPLLTKAKDLGTSISSLSTQMICLIDLLRKNYSSLWSRLESVPDTAEGAASSAEIFCRDFERPKNMSGEVDDRKRDAVNLFWPEYGNTEAELNIGQKIVKIAREQLGKKYAEGKESPAEGFDCSGLVWYCYKEAGITLAYRQVSYIYNHYSTISKSVTPDAVMAADLLFYENNSGQDGYDHIAIATGEGTRIEAPSPGGVVSEYSGLGNPDAILRILSDADTSQGVGGGGDSSVDGGGSSGSSVNPGMDPAAYAALTSYDPYAIIMKDNLSQVEAAGYDYGYLIDMDHGGEFKFYIPEFSEQAGANWSDIDIKGRSVSVKSYKSTNSRTISISLDLYADVGLYTRGSGETGKDTLDRLHKDAFFVKSLEYPDYTTAITTPPSVVHLILGSAINIAGVVSDVVVEHKRPYDDENRAMYLKLSFKVTQTAINPIDYKDVRNGQYALLDTSNINTMFTDGAGISPIDNEQEIPYPGVDPGAAPGDVVDDGQGGPETDPDGGEVEEDEEVGYVSIIVRTDSTQLYPGVQGGSVQCEYTDSNGRKNTTILKDDVTRIESSVPVGSNFNITVKDNEVSRGGHRFSSLCHGDWGGRLYQTSDSVFIDVSETTPDGSPLEITVIWENY